MTARGVHADDLLRTHRARRVHGEKNSARRVHGEKHTGAGCCTPAAAPAPPPPLTPPSLAAANMRTKSSQLSSGRKAGPPRDTSLRCCRKLKTAVKVSVLPGEG